MATGAAYVGTWELDGISDADQEANLISDLFSRTRHTVTRRRILNGVTGFASARGTTLNTFVDHLVGSTTKLTYTPGLTFRCVSDELNAVDRLAGQYEEVQVWESIGAWA